MLALALVLLAESPSHAYETDQLTDRSVSLADSMGAANRIANEMLADAVRETNGEVGCDGRTPFMQRQLAASIYKVMAFQHYVPERGEFSGVGFGSYAAELEQADDVARRDFRDGDYIYADVRPKDNLVVGSMGIASTIRLGDVLVGTDKPDHFFAQGYTYLVESRWGVDEVRALEWGEQSERFRYGLMMTDVFSYADLAANEAGYRFYRSLLSEGSAFQRDERGCVAQVRPFDWAEWVSDGMDEVLDPPLLVDPVAARVRDRLVERRDEICADYPSWGPEVARRQQIVAEQRHVWVPPAAPEPVDPWRLETLCAESTAALGGATVVAER